MQRPFSFIQGQAKPWTSRPRINWQHPLAWGLSTYLYDHNGVIVDLVNNTIGKFFGTAGLAGSKYGFGRKFAAAGWGFMPPLPTAMSNRLGGAAPYSAAMGTVFIGALPATSPGPDSGCVSIQAASNNEDTIFGFNTWPNGAGGPFAGDTVSIVVNNANNAWFSQPIVPFKFQTWQVSVPTAAIANLYSNGVFDSQYTASATTFPTGDTPQIMFSTARADFQDFGPGINGFISFFGFWARRILTPNDHLEINQRPWAPYGIPLLIYPEDEVLSRRVRGLIAAGTSVTVNFGGAFEFTSGVRSDALVLLEYLASVCADRPLQLEAISTVRRDNSALPELVAGLSANAASQLEFLRSMRSDSLSPLEATAAFRSDVVALMEALSGQRSDAAVAAEIIASLRADLVGPLENLGAVLVTGNSALQLETIAKLNADQGYALENVAAARSDATGPSEFAAGVTQQSGMPAESMAGVIANSPVDVENLGAIAVTGNSALQLETTSKTSFDQGLSAENTSGVRSDAVPDTEALAGVAKQVAVSVEFPARSQTDAAAPMENLGAIAVTGNAAVPIEITAGMRSDASADAESITGLQASSVVAVENLAKTQRDAAVQSEVQGGVSVVAGSAVQIEVTRSFASFTASIFEIFSRLSLLRPDPRFVSLFLRRRTASLLAPRKTASLLGLPVPQGPDLSVMDVGETVNGSVDFSKWLPSGTTIASIVSVTVANYYPEGGSNYIELDGVPVIGTVPASLGGSGVANAAVLQQWTGLAPGIARVTATILTSDDQTLIGWVHQPVQDPD